AHGEGLRAGGADGGDLQHVAAGRRVKIEAEIDRVCGELVEDPRHGSEVGGQALVARRSAEKARVADAEHAFRPRAEAVEIDAVLGDARLFVLKGLDGLPG